MEIINDDRRNPEGSIRTGRNIYIGSVFILAGLNWLLYNLDLISYSVFSTVFSWNILLIVIGGYLMVLRKYAGGIILTGVGLAYTICELLNLNIQFGEIILPATLIAVGLAIILNRK